MAERNPVYSRIIDDVGVEFVKTELNRNLFYTYEAESDWTMNQPLKMVSWCVRFGFNAYRWSPKAQVITGGLAMDYFGKKKLKLNPAAVRDVMVTENFYKNKFNPDGLDDYAKDAVGLTTQSGEAVIRKRYWFSGAIK